MSFTVGCFECDGETLDMWFRNHCRIYILGTPYEIPGDDNRVKHLIDTHVGSPAFDDAAARLLVIKVLRGFYASEGLKSGLSAFLSRRRKEIAREYHKTAAKGDAHGDAVRWALSVKPLHELESN